MIVTKGKFGVQRKAILTFLTNIPGRHYCLLVSEPLKKPFSSPICRHIF